MTNLKKLASKILERQGISHARLKPKKWEISELRKYLPTVWFSLVTTYYTTYNPFTRKATHYNEKQLIDKRSYQIIKK